MRVFIGESAYADLERIFRWIEIDSASAAQSVIDRIGTSMERLSAFPRLGRLGSVGGTLELVVPRLPYIVVYTIDEDADELRVVAIFHAAQDRSSSPR
jgi:toxin ParE1/3/4